MLAFVFIKITSDKSLISSLFTN